MKCSSQDMKKCSSQNTNQQSTSHQLFDQYQPPLQTNKVLSSLTTWLTNFAKLFITSFWKSEEIQIWQRVDRNGQIWWHAYNPRTKRAGVFDSESEVRVWLEKQYYI
jgi:hypothetical protein